MIFMQSFEIICIGFIHRSRLQHRKPQAPRVSSKKLPYAIAIGLHKMRLHCPVPHICQVAMRLQAIWKSRNSKPHTSLKSLMSQVKSTNMRDKRPDQQSEQYSQIQQLIAELPAECTFHPSKVQPEWIANAEAKSHVQLPESYRRFVLEYDTIKVQGYWDFYSSTTRDQ